jgi:hypothetical protein
MPVGVEFVSAAFKAPPPQQLQPNASAALRRLRHAHLGDVRCEALSAWCLQDRDQHIVDALEHTLQ